MYTGLTLGGRQRTRILETTGNLKNLYNRASCPSLSCTRKNLTHEQALAAGGAYGIETKAR